MLIGIARLVNTGNDDLPSCFHAVHGLKLFTIMLQCANFAELVFSCFNVIHMLQNGEFLIENSKNLF